MEYKLKNGGVISDEEIERECEEYESGSWEGRLTDFRVGQAASTEKNASLLFKQRSLRGETD